ncbi:MAG: thiamine pyrophosphate-binding protein, partial [Chloroflexota bacterium]
MTGADAILNSLKANGIDYLFVNAGSDFAPIIESYAGAEDLSKFPEPLIIPHECVAVGMAHGFYLATGRPQGVMVHVHVGLANAVMGVVNAHADNIPMIVISGRTPLTEHGRLGARQTAIQYGQEVFDQTALVRDITKFNYELRYAEQATTLVKRAVAIAKSEPSGPVYLSLPREPLAEQVPADHPTQKISQEAPTAPQPDQAVVKKAAKLLADASNPLMILQRGDPAGKVSQFVGRIAARHAIKIVESGGQRSVVTSDHPMRMPGKVNAHLPEADVVLVVDASVPWIEKQTRPNPEATVIHIGPDPLFATMPMRSYQADLVIAGNTGATLEKLSTELDMLEPETGDRYAGIEAEHQKMMAALQSKAHVGNQTPMSADWVGLCVSEILPEEALIFSERGPKIAKML